MRISLRSHSLAKILPLVAFTALGVYAFQRYRAPIAAFLRAYEAALIVFTALAIVLFVVVGLIRERRRPRAPVPARTEVDAPLATFVRQQPVRYWLLLTFGMFGFLTFLQLVWASLTATAAQVRGFYLLICVFNASYILYVDRRALARRNLEQAA